MVAEEDSNNFKHNLYKAGKSLLDAKCLVSIKVDQANLDHHNTSCLNDKSYDVFSDELEDLLPKPQVTKILKKGSFAYNDFLNSISFRRNASAPRLNGIP